MRVKDKAVWTLALALPLSLALAACGSSGSNDGPSAAGSSDTATTSGTDATTEPAVDFPAGKQITIVVPYAAGGASDTTARIYAQELQKAIGTSIVVTNVTGASGAIGLQQVASSKPDGYTMAYMPVESTMLKALGLTDISSEDFSFVGRAMTIPAAITVPKDAPYDTFQEFIDYAKAHPGEVQVGNSGTGSIWQIAAASIEDKEGVKFTHVPFDGAAPAVAALLGHNIQAVAVSPSEVKAGVDSGDFKVLVVLGEQRSSVVPDVKTAQELGIDITIQGWGGFAVPKGTPQGVIDVLGKASETAINSQAMKDLLTSKGYEPAYLDGADMDKTASDQLAYFAELIPKLGIAQ